MIVAIDPGSKESALVVMHGVHPQFKMYDSNEAVLARLPALVGTIASDPDHMAIEMVACYGMAVGAEVFDTCVWIGRFIEAWNRPYTRVYRKDVKITLCNSMKAKDGNIRQALIDLYSGGKGAEVAIGKKAAPGPLFGFSGDLWAALAVGVTYQNRARAVPA
jgi:hypothetical protein